MSQTIVDNAIMAKANHSLTPLKGHGRNPIQQLETKLLDSYNMSLDMCKEPS